MRKPWSSLTLQSRVCYWPGHQMPPTLESQATSIFAAFQRQASIKTTKDGWNLTHDDSQAQALMPEVFIELGIAAGW